MIELPAMTSAQEQAWQALIRVSAHMGHQGWCLVGGQMVHLHCYERGAMPNRPTDDGDAALDVRGRPQVLFEFTTALKELGFRAAGESMEGHQHRWVLGAASIDVLIPRGVGPRARGRRGVSGGTTLEAPGMQQALDRAEPVDVSVGGVTGAIPRPNLLGALVVKAAAYTVTKDRDRLRHVLDFAVLSTLAARRDLIREQLTPRDRRYLNGIVAAMAGIRPEWIMIDGAEQGISGLSAALSEASAVAFGD
jgi:hypothetical protein